MGESPVSAVALAAVLAPQNYRHPEENSFTFAHECEFLGGVFRRAAKRDPMVLEIASLETHRHLAILHRVGLQSTDVEKGYIDNGDNRTS